ncbi:MAG: MotA/TolQ/ExbB proton channel family protein, partial [Methylococcales bacterium]
IRRNKVQWAFLDDFAIDFVHLALKTSFLIKRTSANTSPSAPATAARFADTIIKKPLHDSHEEVHV